ncbi:MAG: sigma-70 family RNA polymerase sigma factor [Acidobacteriia bacterium]|nr:sigma-70 family RNA polymerase sigma factor [Terriglobia bacterium]
MDGRSTARSTLEDVFREHYGRLVGILTRLVGERGQAEDLVAEAFWRLSSRPALFRPETNLAGWLYRTAVNLGLDMMRADSRRKRKEQMAGETAFAHLHGAEALGAILREEKKKQVRTVLAILKPAQAQLLLLRNTGLSYRELSDLLKLKRGSIGTLLARAEAEFEKRYCALYGGEP